MACCGEEREEGMAAPASLCSLKEEVEKAVDAGAGVVGGRGFPTCSGQVEKQQADQGSCLSVATCGLMTLGG